MDDQQLLNAIHALVGAGAGSGIVITFAKFLFQRIVNTIEAYTSKMDQQSSKMDEQSVRIQEALQKISTISVKLELLDHHHIAITKLTDMVQSHDKQIAIIQERMDNGKTRDFKPIAV